MESLAVLQSLMQERLLAAQTEALLKLLNLSLDQRARMERPALGVQQVALAQQETQSLVTSLKQIQVLSSNALTALEQR